MEIIESMFTGEALLMLLSALLAAGCAYGAVRQKLSTVSDNLKDHEDTCEDRQKRIWKTLDEIRKEAHENRVETSKGIARIEATLEHMKR